MACVYFEPDEPRPEPWKGWPVWTLGVPHNGRCRARAAESYQPGDELLLQACNQGYVRNRCTRFPGGPDAIRFSATVDRGKLRIRFATETDHQPVASGCGELFYDPDQHRFSAAFSNPVLHRQLTAFARWICSHVAVAPVPQP